MTKLFCPGCTVLPARETVQSVRPANKAMLGATPWVALGFAGICTGLIVIVAVAHRPTGYIYGAPDTYFRVIERIDDYAFVMQRVEHGVPQVPTVFHFCTDYQPQFSAGMSLSWFAYDDRGSCVSVAPADRGYVIVRNSDHWPKLANNCEQDYVHDKVMCDGIPKFEEKGSN